MNLCFKIVHKREKSLQLKLIQRVGRSMEIATLPFLCLQFYIYLGGFILILQWFHYIMLIH